MRTLSHAIALSLFCAAVGCSEPPDYVYDPNGGGGTHTKPDAGESDAGTSPDGGCPVDSDGTSASSSFVVSEIAFASPGYLELYNDAATERALSNITFAGSVAGVTLPAKLAPGDRTIANVNLSTSQGELAVYASGTMIQYVCWGPQLQQVTVLQTDALSKNLWIEGGVCVATDNTTKAIHLRGSGIYAADFVSAAPTPLGCAR